MNVSKHKSFYIFLIIINLYIINSFKINLLIRMLTKSTSSINRLSFLPCQSKPALLRCRSNTGDGVSGLHGSITIMFPAWGCSSSFSPPIASFSSLGGLDSAVASCCSNCGWFHSGFSWVRFYFSMW